MSDSEKPFVTTSLSLTPPHIRLAFIAFEVPLVFDAEGHRFILSALLSAYDLSTGRKFGSRRILVFAGDPDNTMAGWRESCRVKRLMHFPRGVSVPSNFTSSEVNQWLRPGVTIRRRNRDRLRIELMDAMTWAIAREAERRFNAIKLGPEAVH